MKLLNYFKKATSYTSLIIVCFGLITIASIVQTFMDSNQIIINDIAKKIP